MTPDELEALRRLRLWHYVQARILTIQAGDLRFKPSKRIAWEREAGFHQAAVDRFNALFENWDHVERDAQAAKLLWAGLAELRSYLPQIARS